MGLRIVVASDSFKGSLSSGEANAAIAHGLQRELPDSVITQVAVADGGEGTMSMIVDALEGDYIDCKVADPLMRPTVARYGIVISRGIRTAVIEMAEANGLPLLTSGERDPRVTTTYGTGQLFADAYNHGCRKFIIGLGGSATNDGGTGMLRALGAIFRDENGTELPQGGEPLKNLKTIDLSKAQKDILESPFSIICDVDNPLTGPAGASYVFGPQKGATPEMIPILDEALSRYGEVLAEMTGRDIAGHPGAGAAGGMGAAFLAFFNARLLPGIEATLDAIDFTDLIKGADLIITGEGRIDSQTLHGKTPIGVLRKGKEQGIPVIALGGIIEDPEAMLKAGFAAAIPVRPNGQPLAEAMQPATAKANLTATAASIARGILSYIKK